MNALKVVSVALAVLIGLSGPVAVSAQSREAGTPPTTAAEPGQTQEKEDPGVGYQVGAGVATAINIPLRSALCVLGGVAGFVVLLITFGSGYRTAARAAEEGCGGPWVITPAHLKGEPAKNDVSN